MPLQPQILEEVQEVERKVDRLEKHMFYLQIVVIVGIMVVIGLLSLIIHLM